MAYFFCLETLFAFQHEPFHVRGRLKKVGFFHNHASQACSPGTLLSTAFYASLSPSCVVVTPF